MRQSPDREAGAALLLALLVTLLLAALGASLIVLGDTEAALGQAHRGAAEVLYAADAALERALTEIRPVATWTGLLTGALRSPMSSMTSTPAAPWGATIDLTALTAELQAESDVVFGAGSNAPVWRVYASGSLDAAAGVPLPAAPAFLVVWVADDPAESDMDPFTDANDVVLVRAMALNAQGMRVRTEASVQRAGARVRVLAWRLGE